MADERNITQGDLLRIRDIVCGDPVALGRWPIVTDYIVAYAADNRSIKRQLKDRDYSLAILQTLQFWHSEGGQITDLLRAFHSCNLNHVAGQVAQLLERSEREPPSRPPHQREYSSTVWFEVAEVVSSFTGREAELKSLHQKIVEAKNANDFACIFGEGGMGKTTLARKYAHDQMDYFQGNAAWICADTPATMRNSFIRLVNQLGLSEQVDPAASNEEIATVVYDRLGDKKCLVIFDNAEDFDEFLPKVGNPGKMLPYILVTSRRKDLTPEKKHNLELGPLTLADSVLWIQSQLPNSSEENATHLADELSRFPLALQRAITYIVDQFVMDDNAISKYLEIFAIMKRTLVDGGRFHTSDEYTLASSVTWNLSLDLVRDMDSDNDLQQFFTLVTGDQDRINAIGVALCHTARREFPRLMSILLTHCKNQELTGLTEIFAGHASPLHILAAFGDPSPETLKCVDLLLDKEYHKNDLKNLATFLKLKNSQRETALDICCEHANVMVAAKILMATYESDHSSDTTIHFWLNGRILSKLYHFIPEAMISILDTSWDYQQGLIAQTKKHKMEFSVISGVSGSQQDVPLHGIVNHATKVQRRLLLHPLTKQYLESRWTTTTKIFAYGAAMAQCAVLLGYTAVISICNRNPNYVGTVANRTNAVVTDVNEESSDFRMPGPCGEIAEFTILVMLLVSALLLKEVFQLSHLGCRLYFRNMYNTCQALFGLIGLVSLLCGLVSSLIPSWFFPTSMIGFFLVWLIVMLQLKNLPICGIYISILTQVTWKSFKIMLLFLPTLGIFSQVFQILVPQGFESLDEPGLIVKLMTMMFGELTFDEMIKEVRPGKLYYNTFLVVFALFAFVAAVIFLNLLVAMAVNVTQNMENNAMADVARCELEQIYFMATFRGFLASVRRLWCWRPKAPAARPLTISSDTRSSSRRGHPPDEEEIELVVAAVP